MVRLSRQGTVTHGKVCDGKVWQGRMMISYTGDIELVLTLFKLPNPILSTALVFHSGKGG